MKTPEALSPQQIERLAADAGLALDAAQMQDFAAAAALARRLAAQVARDLPFAEEPAVAFRLHRRRG